MLEPAAYEPEGCWFLKGLRVDLREVWFTISWFVKHGLFEIWSETGYPKT